VIQTVDQSSGDVRSLKLKFAQSHFPTSPLNSYKVRYSRSRLGTESADALEKKRRCHS